MSIVLTGDYHTHTPYSHGENTVEENVVRAKELGLKEVGITDHGISHVAFGLRRKKINAYIAECRAAQEKHGIKVLVGLEANIRGKSGKCDLTEKEYEFFDLYLCGKHTFIWYDTFGDMCRYGVGNLFSDKRSDCKKLIDYNTKAYIAAIRNNPIDAVTHLNYRCPCDTLEVAKCAADHGTYLELNSKKQHLSDEQLGEIFVKTDVRFIINSDAHSAQRVGDTALVDEQLSRLQFPMERIDNVNGRTPNFRFTAYKQQK